MSTEKTAGRLIAFQHRRKKTRSGEARPTVFAIQNGEGNRLLKADDAYGELDFVHHKFPTIWRDAQIGEDLSSRERHHIRFRKPNKPTAKEPNVVEETLESTLAAGWKENDLEIETKGRAPNKTKKLVGIPNKVGEDFDGVRTGDTLIGIFGGSGFSLVIALINKATEVGARVFLTAPKNLKVQRDEKHAVKEDDAELLLDIWKNKPTLFHQMYETDVISWEVMHSWDLTEQAMTQRKKVVQRAEAVAEHAVYVSNEYVGARLAEEVLKAKMGNQSVKVVKEAEAREQRRLEDTIKQHPLYQKLFSDIKGFGPRGFGKVMSAVRDPRRFPRERVGSFLRFTGYAAVKGKNGRPTIQRFRRGPGNTPGNPEIKQAIWLLVNNQFALQTDTPWGSRFRAIKAQMRATNPLPELICFTKISLIKREYTPDAEVAAGREGSCTVVFGKGKSHTYTGARIEMKAEGDNDKDDGNETPGEETGNGTAGKGRWVKNLVVPEERIPLHKGKWDVSNGFYTVTLPDGSVIYRPGKSINTDIHIHKKAGWRLGTEFLIWMFNEWWKYIDEMEAERGRKSGQLAA